MLPVPPEVLGTSRKLHDRRQLDQLDTCTVIHPNRVSQPKECEKPFNSLPITTSRVQLMLLGRCRSIRYVSLV